MDAAISIASGRSFLGQFKVNESGPVIIVQNENAEWIIKERMSAIAVHKGIGGQISGFHVTWPDELPIYYINNQGFSLSNPDHQQQLVELIQSVKPVLLILDPLYLMFDGDVNSAKDLNPALSWLIGLKHTYGVSIMLIHHWRKSAGSTKRGGQRMLGSTTLHGWVESAWYVQAGEEITVEREFRSAQAPQEIKLKMDLGIDIENSVYSCEVYEGPEEDDAAIKNYIEQHPKASPAEIAKELSIKEKKVKSVLEG
jgi:RecA-family ATPase